MPLGATNPCPFRLGGDVLAENQSRIAADLVASMRVAPLGVMVIAAGAPTAYYGRNGTGVATFDSGATYVLGGTLTYSAVVTADLAITLGGTWYDEIGVSTLVNIVGVDAVPLGTSDALDSITWDRSAITLEGASGSYVVVIYADDCARTIDQYGGDLEKRNSITEAESPYAWGWLIEMRSMRGSAYANEGLVDIENLAWARMFGFLQRVAEQEAAASDPARTADGRLRRWAQWLGLAILSTDSEATIRRKCSAFKLLKLGAVEPNLETLLPTLLGSAYVGMYRDIGTLDAPPVPTYWSEVTIPAGTTAALSLGTGGGTVANDEPVWLSSRFHLTVVITVPPAQTVQQVANLCESDLTRLLNNLLPSVATFCWGRLDSYSGDEGFILDQSQLAFDLL
jgi:hypothetical protein